MEGIPQGSGPSSASARSSESDDRSSSTPSATGLRTTCSEDLRNARQDKAWKTINSTMQTISNSLDSESISDFFNSIMKFPILLETVVIPDCKCCRIHFHEKEQECLAYSIWILGRMFYFLGCKRLSGIHQLSIEGQIRIMQLLLKLHPTLFMRIVDNYIQCLHDIIEVQKGSATHTKPFVLKRFISRLQAIGDLELDLSPCFVEIANDDECTILQNYILTIINSVALGLAGLGPDMLISIWEMICYLIPQGPASIQINALQIAANLLFADGYPPTLSIRSSALWQTFYGYVEHLILNEKSISSLNKDERVAVANALKSILTATAQCVHKISVVDQQFLVVVLTNMMQGQISSTIRDIIHDSIAIFARSLLDHIEEMQIDSNSIDAIVNSFSTDEYVIPGLKYCIMRELISHVPALGKLKQRKNNGTPADYDLLFRLCERETHPTDVITVSVLESSRTWQRLWHKLMVSVSSLEEDNTCNVTKMIDMLNLVFSIVECGAAVNAMLEELLLRSSERPLYRAVFYGDSIKHILKSVMAMLCRVRSGLTEGTARNILQTSLKFVGSLMKMPEIRNINVDDINLSIALLALPWLGDVTKELITDQNHVIYHIRRDYRPYSCELKLACIRNLACIESDETFSWRLSLFQLIISKEDSNVVAEAVHNVPFLLAGSSRRCIQDPIIDLLMPAFNSEDSEVKIAVSDSFAKVVCALAGTCAIVRESLNSGVCSKVMCMKCTYEERNYPCFTYAGTVQEMLLKVTSFIMSPVVQIRRNIALSLPSLSNHLPSFRETTSMADWGPFLRDLDHDVRLYFSQYASCLVFDSKWMQEKKHESEESGEEFIPLSQVDREELWTSEPLLVEFCDMLIHAVRQSLESPTDPCQETLIYTVKNIGCIALDCVIYPSLMLLLTFVGHPNGNNAGLAKICLGDIARAHNVVPKDLFVRYKPELCWVMVKVAIGTHLSSSKKNFVCTVAKLAKLFDFEGEKQFFRKESHHVMPCLIAELVKNVRARPILDQVAALMGTTPKELIEVEFQHIYPHIVVSESEAVLTECIEYMKELCSQPVASLISRSFVVIRNELLLEFQSKRDRVLESLRYLASIDPNFKTSSPHLTLEQIADFLQPYFLGVLVHFDGRLTTNDVSESVKQKALLSLPELIRLMGPRHITLVRFKVLATLRIALRLNYSNFPDLSIAAWDAFVHSLEDSSLGPLLSTIFASLLPLLDQFPEEIASIFKYLIVDKQQDLWFYFKELYFVPQHPALKEIHATIQQFAKRYGPKTCYGKIREKLTYVIHENVDVRLHALKDMGVLLSESRFQLNEATVNKEKVEPCIIEMLNVLTDACHDPDERVKMAAGECLGEIGAVDPGIIPHRKCAEDSNWFALDVEQQDFAVLAINQLARGFQKATNITTVDAFSYAIQELLKVYEIQCDGPLWQRFPPNVQDIMKPLLRSSYRSLVKLEVSYPKPIYGSKLGSSLRDWSSNWALQLLSLVSDKRAQDVFNSCTLVFKRDLPTVLFFLPYILLHALTSCSELQRSDILLELTTLLENPDPARLSGKGAGPLREPLMLAVQNQSADSLLPRSIDHADHVRCCRTVFQLVDFLARWLRQFRNTCGRHVDPMKNKNFKTIHDFLNKMSKLSIARGNYECQEYARALMYLEQYIKENESELQNHLWFFEELYVHLDDPDAVAGTLAIQGQEPSLKQMARAHEVTGQYQNAAACYEQMAQEQMLTPEQVQGMVRCYLSLDQPFTSLKIAEGVIAERPELAQDIHQEYAESLWRMHKFNELEQLVSSPPLANNRTWGVQIGRALLHFRRGDHAELASVLADTKRAVLESLGSMERQHGMYYHNYSDVVKLHILYELEKMSEMLASVVEFSQGSAATSGAASVLVRNLLEEWDQRLAVVQKSSRAVEPILCLRRIVLDQARCILKERDPESAALLNAEIGNCWLRSAKAARKESYHQQAYIYILNAEKYKPPSLFIEKAKLYWEKGDQESAFHTLKRCLEEQFPDAHLFKDMNDRKSERMLCAKAKLLIAMYNDETLKVDTDQSVKNYTSAVHACQQWEKSLVCLAQFYDRLFQGLSDDEKDTKGGEMQLGMVNYFGKSMHHGTKYIYQSMPRMLTLWLDYGSRHADVMKRGEATPSQNSDVETLTRKLTELIASFAKSLPPYQFFTAFSQLVSRICHPKPIVWEQLKTIIVNILIAYPQHALWMLMAPLKSCYAVRAKRCQEILQHPKVLEANLMKMVNDYNNLTDKLIDLTNLPVPDKTETTTVSSLVQSLPALLTSDGFSEIIMPTEQYLNFVLPTMGSPQNHNPFPQKLIYIKIIKDEVTILASLQKPRKITFIGSDGMSYPMMCKPKDDLRKDFRLMEFNGIVNRYLRKDPDSRQRGLHIRTYSVIPLNEECGILEWMPNLVGLRPTLLSMYKQIGVSPSGRIMKEMVHSRHEPFEKKKALFLKIMETLPPILSEWFLITYPDPQSWYLARTTYVQTTAVMSMVGYILGLGDRHGENFLLDTKTGDAVHVDFNCLFNKGDNFDWPEVVPFRLTHNMVNAMGPMGVEGPFRRVCEITLRILRSQSDTLMSVLRPFVYDPIISWGKCRPNGGRKRDQVEMTNENAVQNLTRIERRLQGMVRNVGKCYAIPLSVEGQANSLILEATNVDNLCRMYVGWGAFL